MTIQYRGNYIYIYVSANEVKQNHQKIDLPDGYSYEKIHILRVDNVSELLPYQGISNNYHLTFPPVNSKSPSQISFFINDITKSATLRLQIEKFGQIPDSHYFDKAFDPILVTGDDGKEYNVIPSDQFK